MPIENMKDLEEEILGAYENVKRHIKIFNNSI